MGAHRVELTGFSDGAVPQLKALGLTSEIIAWRLRLFLPVTGPGASGGAAMLGAIFDRHPLLRDARAAA
jgi:protein strawberry notch